MPYEYLFMKRSVTIAYSIDISSVCSTPISESYLCDTMINVSPFLSIQPSRGIRI